MISSMTSITESDPFALTNPFSRLATSRTRSAEAENPKPGGVIMLTSGTMPLLLNSVVGRSPCGLGDWKPRARGSNRSAEQDRKTFIVVTWLKQE